MNQANEGLKPNYSAGYKAYVLVILFITYIFNFADRYLLVAVQTAIQNDLGLSDTQLGLLTGIAFAVFYTFVGIPIARLADHSSRTKIMSLGITIWCALTAASGLAQNYVHLLLARIGVGVGESTATPCSHSLISDYFPPEKRGRAIGFYSLGANIGMFLGMGIGGYIASEFGWRYSFFIVGLPGIILAILIKFTVKEPPRGHSDEVKGDLKKMPLGQTVKYLFSLNSYRHLCIAGSLASFAGFGFMFWVPVFLERVHQVPRKEYSVFLGIVFGLVGGISTIIGGFISDKMSKKNKKWAMYTSVIGVLGMIPPLVFFLLVDNTKLAAIGIVITYLVGLFYFAPTFATIQGLAKPNMRAFAVSIFLLLINLAGMGLGPTIVGFLSDRLKPFFGEQALPHGVESLRYTLLIITVTIVWSAVHYLLAARTLPEDLDKAVKIS